MFKKAGDLLQKELNKKNLAGSAEASFICYVANEIFAGKYKAISFRNRVLEIGVNSNFKAIKLQADSQNIIKNINNKLGKKIIEKIRFKIN